MFFTVKLMVAGQVVFHEVRPAPSATEALQGALIDAGLLEADPRTLTVVVRRNLSPVAIA